MAFSKCHKKFVDCVDVIWLNFSFGNCDVQEVPLFTFFALQASILAGEIIKNCSVVVIWLWDNF